MASEVGGAKLSIHIGANGNTPNSDAQFNQISSFFKGFYDQGTLNNQTLQGGFEQKVITDLGKSFVVFGDQNIQPVAKFVKGQDGAVGTGQDTTIRAGGGDNDIIITDNNNHLVNLGGGNDFLQNTGTGSVTVNAGSGDDSVVGGSGNDTIKGQAGNDALQGRAGNDIIQGGGGNDTIIGGQGNDQLSGGGGKDVFIFGNENTGADTITDFKKGDVLQIVDRNGGGVTTEGANADVTVSQQGSDTLLTFQDGSTILLKNVNSTKLVEDNIDGQFTIQ